MNYGIRCWNEAGQLTFDGSLRTMRQQSKLYVASGSTGSIPLSQLPNGIHGVTFQPANASSSDGVEPYAAVGDGELQYRGGVGDFWLTVLSIAE